MSNQPISDLRRRMLEDMTVRQFSGKTQHDYIRHVEAFASFLGRSPGTATGDDLRRFQFQQVEDGLSGLAFLDQAAKTQQVAVEDSRKALDIANNRYVGGVTTYLDVITAQSTLLTNERLATQLLGQQMVTSVFLVKALGGGWDASQIQNEQVRPELRQTIQQ